MNPSRQRPSRHPPKLTYSNPSQRWVKRGFILAVERLSGRDRYESLYDIWRNEIVPSGERVFGRLLDLVDIDVSFDGWLPAVSDRPLVIIANHPFGIGDGAAALSIAEKLGKPFRVLINAELLKVSEMQRYSLPVDFSETKAALKNNLEIRHEALRLLKDGTNIVVFPGGGVATAPRGFGAAEDLNWKLFPFKLIQEARADVLPLFFSGQNGRLFHLVSVPMLRCDRASRASRMLSDVSLTLRTALLLREFAKLSGRTIRGRIGPVIPWEAMEHIRDRKALLIYVKSRLTRLGDNDLGDAETTGQLLLSDRAA